MPAGPATQQRIPYRDSEAETEEPFVSLFKVLG
jgi:hypothetical protein